ncbi:MAG: SAM-dependent methyltransferase [Lachnospiraceae bacterium]|nr:SAM-dependent methyltransferase [Lachnospiraceae bacterium]
MVKLSDRLQHLADMVSENTVLADVGTDHGYIPIYLLQSKKIKKAYAMDIGKGPLQRAKEHIEECGLGDYIETRLSDGVAALSLDEADTILIAGMGGGLVLHILTEGESVVAAADELILQPQSEIERVREYLYQKGYVIDKEDMVCEDGKYYPMMHVDMRKNMQREFSYSKEEWQVIYRYGEHLLREKHTVLHQYLLYRLEQYEQIAAGLEKQQNTEKIAARKTEVEKEIACINAALSYWKEQQ